MEITMKKYVSATILLAIIIVYVLFVNNSHSIEQMIEVSNTEVSQESYASDVNIENDFDFTNLTLDQGNAYIAFSENDITGFNRWLPFYFKITTDKELTADSAEELLNNNINQAKLYLNTNLELYKTNQLIWSAYKVDDTTFNLTLVIIPEIDALNINGVTQIDRIVLSSESSYFEYDLGNYLIEQRETIPEDELWVSASPIEAIIEGDLTTDLYYSITQLKYNVDEFDIDFSEQYDEIKDYTVKDDIVIEDNIVEYTVEVSLKQQPNGTVFRPFIQVKYNNQIGYMIPVVPVYFR